MVSTRAELVTSRITRLRTQLVEHEADALVVSLPASVDYTTGYRSMPSTLYDGHNIVSICTAERSILVVPASDTAAALDAPVDADDLVPYGTFYFESTRDASPLRKVQSGIPTLAGAVKEAINRLGESIRTLSIEDLGLTPAGAVQVREGCSGRTICVDNETARKIRAIKTPPEIKRLAWAANLCERAMATAIAEAKLGWTELQIANVVSRVMAEGGGTPSQLSIQVGPRTQLGDAFPSQNPWMPGEILRLDVGCRVDGYWSDIARMAVLGEPSEGVMKVYDALRAGQEYERRRARAGVRASELFGETVDHVRESGLSGYRRTHCGHGIGLEVYDSPRIAEADQTELATGMVLCLETPYYADDIGGLLVEDTVVVGEEGIRELTKSSRELVIVPVST